MKLFLARVNWIFLVLIIDLIHFANLNWLIDDVFFLIFLFASIILETNNFSYFLTECFFRVLECSFLGKLFFNLKLRLHFERIGDF